MRQVWESNTSFCSYSADYNLVAGSYIKEDQEKYSNNISRERGEK